MTICTGFSTCWRNTVFLFLCLVALVFSCSSDPCFRAPDLEPPPQPNRRTPDNLLSFFADALERKDIDAYGEALDDYYEYEFVPDIAESLSLPPEMPWWGKTHDVASTENLFSDPDVKAIEMCFAAWGIGLDWEGCSHRYITDGEAEPETTWVHGLCMRFEPNIKVHIEESGEEPVALWVNESLLDMMLVPDAYHPGDWVILRIVETHKDPIDLRVSNLRCDRTQEQVSAAEITSWSAIKYRFR